MAREIVMYVVVIGFAACVVTAVCSMIATRIWHGGKRQFLRNIRREFAGDDNDSR